MKLIFRLFKWLSPLLLLLAAVVLWNTWRVPGLPEAGEAYAFQANAQAVAQRLAVALRFPTVSVSPDAPVAAEALTALRQHLEFSYPLVHRQLQRQIIGGHSLLYHWPGRGGDKKPLLLLAHLDVVPVPPDTQGDWLYPPFQGVVAEGYVWGRGAMDDKAAVITLLEAVEALLAQGFVPARDIYLAFGHDEEIGGARGAATMAAELARRGLEFELVLDEGGALAQGLVPGVEPDIAFVAAGEKGSVNLWLEARAPGGHSSMPSPQTAIGILAAAIARLESNPFPVRFEHSRTFLQAIAGLLPWRSRLLMSNLWLFQSLVQSELEKDPSQAALLRTTTAITLIEGGVKSNVLPTRARALANFRIIPGETPQSVRNRVVAVIADPRIEVEFASPGRPPSPISPLSGPVWDYLQRAIRDTAAPERVAVAPRLTLGGTDARHYQGLSEHVYRFNFLRLQPEDLQRFHGTNERVAVQNLVDMVRFFHRLIANVGEL